MDTFTGMEHQLADTKRQRNETVVNNDRVFAREAIKRYARTTEDPDTVTEHLVDVLGLDIVW